jgi:hypothetical protein
MNEVAIKEGRSLEMRSKVNEAEEVMRQYPQLDLPVTHHFSHGVYARELFIPKDTILTGKIHKFSQFNVLLKGEISVLTENGIERVKAPFTVVSPPGTKRIAYAHEDCVWITVHGTHETDVEKIESQFVAQSDAEYLEFVALLKDQS